MKHLFRTIVASLALVGVAGPAAWAQTCGNLNNDGAGVAGADVTILGQCAAGSCPTITGGICGTGNALDCGDIFEDGVIDAADVDALRIFVTGGDPLYDICTGPGPDITCPGGTVTLGSPTPVSITSNQTWPASCTVVIGGQVTIVTPPGAPATVLRVEAGSIVKGATGTLVSNPAALIFQPGSRIDAIGSPSTPVIFTSTAAPGARSKGDWGGVVFNGKGTVNGPGCQFQSEGLPFSFGGCEADYHCGTAKFVRAEFAGLDFTANNELNLWTMNGCGTQTDMDFIQANVGDDDCLEWFGGTSNHTNMVASGCGDDGFDWQLGWTGSVQFGLQLQNGVLTDTGGDSRGIEADGSEFDQTATPFSDPDMCNMTFVGGKNQAGANNGSDAGILLRRNTRAQIANAIVTGYADNCVELRDALTTSAACTDANSDGSPESLSGNTVIRNSIMYDCGSVGGGPYELAKNGDALDADDANADTGPCDTAAAPGCACDSESWYALLPAMANANGVMPTVTTDLDSTNYPALENSACTGAGTPYNCCTGVGTGFCRAMFDAAATVIGGGPSAFACASINPLFSNVSYLGAVDPASVCTATSCGWMSKPWIEFATN
jgi:hypothetical protein